MWWVGPVVVVVVFIVFGYIFYRSGQKNAKPIRDAMLIQAKEIIKKNEKNNKNNK